MKTIVNKTHRPLKIALARGRALRLGPCKEGQIATNDAERESVQKLVASGDVEVYDDSSRLASGAGADSAGRASRQVRHDAKFSGGRGGDR